MTPPKTNPPFLHIYAQEGHHSEAYIVGDVAALARLRDAIDAALRAPDGLGQAHVMCGDGEGYLAHVVRVASDRMERMQLPYGSAKYGTGRYPSSLVPQESGDEILEDDDAWFKWQRKMGFVY